MSEELENPDPDSPTASCAPDLAGLAATLGWLQRLVDDRTQLVRLSREDRKRLIELCGRLSKPTREETKAMTKARRKLHREERRAHDRALLDQARVRVQRARLVFPTPDPHEDPRDRVQALGPSPRPQLTSARTCYTCKSEYRDLHWFYDALCPQCAEFNLAKRNQSADLSGRLALLTGGRVKIGYQAGIKLLRAGARLIVTTRFPRDAAMRYAAEPDFPEWQSRLDIYGLDLRHTPSVEVFLDYVDANYERLDFILNNACQTVRRPPGFYQHMIQAEESSIDELPIPTRRLLAGHESLRRLALRGADGRGDAARLGWAAAGAMSDERKAMGSRPGIYASAALSQVPLVAGDVDVSAQLFPAGAFDPDLQQLDLRPVNSWRLPLAEVPTVELLEVHLVNAVAPFVFNARLKALMLKTPGRDKHIVNVSAMEGQFYRAFKTDKHPHTNMAKAALNMMTRTSAPDYHRDGIHMNSVDTGWITDEDPFHVVQRKREEHGFHPPLDHVDAAARICAPIFDGIRTGEHTWGQFLKDYLPTRW
ncbi:MAG: SDR family oxidoreductase [Planctomycetota bacterium]